MLVPWAALTGTFLTEGFAYPLLGWALLAIYATVARPSLRGDFLALAAIGAAMFARTGLVLLVVALGVAVVGQELRLAGSPRDVLRVPLRLARRHTLLVVVGVAGLLVLATGHSGTLKGSWYSNAGPRWGDTWHGLLYVISSVSTGVGFVPAIAALAYAGTQIWRPRSQADLALAWIVVGVLATFTLTLISGPIEERYVFYWALPCAVALAVAASRQVGIDPGDRRGDGARARRDGRPHVARRRVRLLRLPAVPGRAVPGPRHPARDQRPPAGRRWTSAAGPSARSS